MCNFVSVREMWIENDFVLMNCSQFSLKSKSNIYRLFVIVLGEYSQKIQNQLLLYTNLGNIYVILF